MPPIDGIPGGTIEPIVPPGKPRRGILTHPRKMERRMSSQIVDFSVAAPSETASPAAERLIAGDPRQTITHYYSDPTHQFFSGRWSSTPGKWRIRYTESEFCCLTQGRVALENTRGDRWT